jgi:hypothetical protein
MNPGFDNTGAFSFRQDWPTAVIVLLIVAAVAYVAFMYSRETVLSPVRRVLLGGLRAALCVLLLLLLFEPVLAFTRSVTVPNNVLVLVDVSESMAIADARKRPEDLEEAAWALGRVPIGERRLPEPIGREMASVSRLDLAKGILQHPELKFLTHADEKHRPRCFLFGDQLEPVGEEEGLSQRLADAKAVGRATRLGEALREAVERYRSQPIAAVVVLTDGVSNEGIDSLEAASELRVPVYPVPLGLPQPDDVRIQAVVVADTVFPKDRVPVRVQVASSASFVGREVDVILRSGDRELDRRTIRLNGAPQFEELAFVPEPRADAMPLEVHLAPLPGEASTENNRAERLVKVIDEKIKVLYVEGKPRWEFRYLRPVLLRDHRLEVKFLLTEGDPDLPRASNQYLARFPDDEAAAFAYDLVILGDVPASGFTPGQLDWLEKLVREKGGSFLMLAGDQHAPVTYLDTPVARLLPVKLAGPGRELTDPSVFPALTRAGVESLMMALAPDDDHTRQLWSLVRPLHTLPRLEGAKPGATVLATLAGQEREPDAYPLVAWQRYGSGKSLFVGTDQLWRLRFKHGDEYHARFWGQAIQFLTLSRLLGENRRIRLETERKTYRAGERVPLYANVLDETFQPVQAETYPVFVASVPPQGEPRSVVLRAVPGTPGLYQGAMVMEQAGAYQLHTGPQDEAHANKVDFQVTSANREQLEPAVRLELLEKVAELSGGKRVSVADLPGLRDEWKAPPRTVTLPPQESELWNHWLVLAAVLGCAGTEWFLRRRWDAA